MKTLLPTLFFLSFAASFAALASTPPAAQMLLTEWQASATGEFDAGAGEALWYREVDGRRCTSCHTDDLTVAGRHERTGKVIEPMARSINPERLTDAKKVKKWLYRNCKWTFGRECTAQEKGDVVTWLLAQ